LQYNRGQWSIEDRLHYVRDFTYDEDRSQVRRKNGPRMMACLRNFAISILNLLGLKKIAQAVRYFTSRPHKTLAALGF
jgi:predicted transposase YbfD/YdcC